MISLSIFFVGNLAYNIFKGPIEIVLGIAIGLVVGPLLWFLPCKHKVGSSSYYQHHSCHK